ALFPTGRRVESFADDLNTRRGIEGYIPHLAWATRRAGAKSVFLKPKVETKSLTMWCAASPLAMPPWRASMVPCVWVMESGGWVLCAWGVVPRA
ncbi:hypothetical protein Lal_00043771, partial [Lupinus albus]